jgi:hypothetical protein
MMTTVAVCRVPLVPPHRLYELAVDVVSVVLPTDVSLFEVVAVTVVVKVVKSVPTMLAVIASCDVVVSTDISIGYVVFVVV